MIQKLNQFLAQFGLLIGFCVATGLYQSAHGCTVCIPYPTKTVADYLVDSHTVVLARENPEKPWSYIVVEVLKGKADPTPIASFVNSSTRRLLNIYPQRGVVFARESSHGAGWRNLGFASESSEEVIREIIRRAPEWKRDTASNPLRLEFFADYLGHENRRLHELAYLEIGRAPYQQIKDLGTRWPLEQVRALLDKLVFVEWHPLAILILAQSEDARDQAYISGKFSTFERYSLTTNLSAWATALIEIEEASAIDSIEEKYFRSSERSKEELVAVTAALSEHGNNGHTHLRDQIVQSYAVLIENHPNMAGQVVRDLMTWERRDLADQMAKILPEATEADPLTAYAIKMYLAHQGQSKTIW